MQAARSSKTYRRLTAKLHRKATRRRAIRYGLVGFNVLLLAAASLFVLQNTQETQAASAAASLSSQTETAAPASPLDQVSSSSIAVTVARLSGLPEMAAVTNQADSESTEMAMATSSSVVAKPQVVATDSKSKRDIVVYVAKSGDTVSHLAQKFHVTSDSIRWSNNISGDTLQTGVKLYIPPLTGIVYKVQPGDTPAKLADKFNASKDKIIAFNDAETTGLKVGERILIPGGSKAAAVVHSVVSTVSFGGWGGGSASYGYNGYDYGYCTWWVANLRAKAGNPVPANLGNASTWAVRAAAFGLPTGSKPRVGAAVVTSTAGAGHVAYVTAVGNGTITISEMNHIGWNRVDSRTIPTQSNYRYVY